jgi:glycosyltransferase involved in cell wall biosynthesis
MHRKPPQLCILLYDFASSGVARNAIRIAEHAASRGFSTELWVTRNSGPLKSQVSDKVSVLQVVNANGIASNIVEPAQGLRRRISSLATVPKLAQLITERKPEVLLSAGNHIHLAAGLAYRLAGRPSHTCLIGRASNAAPRIGRESTLLGTFVNWIDAVKYREMRKIIAVSHELAGDLKLQLRIPEERIIVIPNGVDIAEIERKAAEPLDDPWFAFDAPPVIVSAGRLSKQKNYGLLIDAFARLRQKQSARLIILGEGSRKSREALADRATAHGIGDDVRLPGFELNPMRYFARARVFALTSLWEGASNALLEAIACGCPVVATDCRTGIRELLDNGRLGAIVPANDPTSLAHAIGVSLASPSDRAKLRAHAYQFQLETVLAKYVEVIRSEMAIRDRA